MEFHLPEALSITQYESISGERVNPTEDVCGYQPLLVAISHTGNHP